MEEIKEQLSFLTILTISNKSINLKNVINDNSGKNLIIDCISDRKLFCFCIYL